jgi:peroxiredoxin
MPYKFLFSLLIASLIWSPQSATAQFLEAGVQKLEVPVSAPNFSLKALGGGKISLKGLRGKIVILTFFSPSCSVCERQSSSIDKLAEEIKSNEVVFLLVADRVKEKELVRYKKEFHISIPILINRDGSVSRSYSVRGHHETFFIGRKGKIIAKTFAEKDWTSASMKNLIQYLLREDKQI